MMKKKLKDMFHRSISLTLGLCLTFSGTTVYAVDSVDGLNNQTSSLQSELTGMNTELNAILAELDATVAKMEATTQEAEKTRTELAIAKDNEAKQYEAMKLRIKYIYESGSSNFFELLITADSMADFLNKADFVSALSNYDRDMMEHLVEIQNEVATKEQQLQTEQASLEELKTSLDTKQTALTSRISSTSGELSAYQERLERAKAAAAAAQAQIDAKASAVVAAPPAETVLPAPAAPPATTAPGSGTTVIPGDTTGNTGSVTPPDSEEEAPAPAPPPSVSAGTDDVSLLAALIECEAGGGSYEGLVAVGAVVLNRVRHPSYPSTIRGVIYQSGQFSPASSGKLDSVLERGASASCYSAANDALSGVNPIGECLSFRSASTGHSGINLGGNVFF